jgi:elongation factor G
LWDKDQFVGVFDLINQTGAQKQPSQLNPSLAEEVEQARIKLIEVLCEHDELLMEEFLVHEKNVPADSIKRSIRRLISDGEGKIVPVFAGASLRNIGVERLLDAIVDYLPSPRERPELELRTGSSKSNLSDLLKKDKLKGNKGHRPSIGAIASVFKVVKDRQRGILSFVRVYHGALHRNAAMWNTNIHQFEKSLNMLQISAGQTDEIPHLSTGQIGALTGLKHARTGDTLITFPSHQAPESLRSLQIRPPDIPPAVAFIAIEPHTPTGLKNLEVALESASREDPSLRWSKDEKTDQFILSGMGKLHLDIAQDHLRNKYKVEAFFGKIEVDYKECLLSSVPPQRAEYDRVIASKAGKAACTAILEPQEARRKDTLVESSVERDGNIISISIPTTGESEDLPFDTEEVRQQLFNGAVAALSRGPRRGSPMHGCHASITYNHETDYFGPSSGAHIVKAAYYAVRGALKEAYARKQIGILEPVMMVHIQCPEEAGGAVQHDLASARGGVVLEIKDMDNAAASDGGIDLSNVYVPPDPYESVQSLRDPKRGITRMLEIVAKVPLNEMLDYDSHLRGKTSGRHSLLMTLDTFERVTGPRERALESI